MMMIKMITNTLKHELTTTLPVLAKEARVGAEVAVKVGAGRDRRLISPTRISRLQLKPKPKPKLMLKLHSNLLSVANVIRASILNLCLPLSYPLLLPLFLTPQPRKPMSLGTYIVQFQLQLLVQLQQMFP